MNNRIIAKFMILYFYSKNEGNFQSHAMSKGYKNIL